MTLADACVPLQDFLEVVEKNACQKELNDEEERSYGPKRAQFVQAEWLADRRSVDQLRTGRAHR